VLENPAGSDVGSFLMILLMIFSVKILIFSMKILFFSMKISDVLYEKSK